MARIQLKSDGALLLGDYVSCDGFSFHHPIRAQTHIHADHMADFDTSKANQTILVSQATKALLCALYNADIPYRRNIKAIDYMDHYCFDGGEVQMIPSNHMLGSAQVKVICQDGCALGYSSDFFWPLDSVIQVDELVIDSTYGDPMRVRRYGQQRADDILVDFAVRCIAGRVSTVCIGHVGRIHHALALLGDVVPWPIVCSPRVFKIVKTYRDHGFYIPEVFESTSELAIEAMRGHQPVFAFATLPERRHLAWLHSFRKITLSAHMLRPDDPLTTYDNGDCCIALTDHADFDGTLDYVKASGAKVVYTDPRSGNAEALACAIKSRLDIEAKIVQRLESREWG